MLQGPWLFKQSSLEAHDVLHAVALAQRKEPGQEFPMPAMHVPFPSQVLAGVKPPSRQDGLPHVVPAATCSQTPPAAQLPVLPQGGAAVHWPARAAVPAVTFAHVPSGEPVSAIVQA
jgi:hypothetical protein